MNTLKFNLSDNWTFDDVNLISKLNNTFFEKKFIIINSSVESRILSSSIMINSDDLVNFSCVLIDNKIDYLYNVIILNNLIRLSALSLLYDKLDYKNSYILNSISFYKVYLNNIPVILSGDYKLLTERGNLVTVKEVYDKKMKIRLKTSDFTYVDFTSFLDITFKLKSQDNSRIDLKNNKIQIRDKFYTPYNDYIDYIIPVELYIKVLSIFTYMFLSGNLQIKNNYIDDNKTIITYILNETVDDYNKINKIYEILKEFENTVNVSKHRNNDIVKIRLENYKDQYTLKIEIFDEVFNRNMIITPLYTIYQDDNDKVKYHFNCIKPFYIIDYISNEQRKHLFSIFFNMLMEFLYDKHSGTYKIEFNKNFEIMFNGNKYILDLSYFKIINLNLILMLTSLITGKLITAKLDERESRLFIKTIDELYVNYNKIEKFKLDKLNDESKKYVHVLHMNILDTKKLKEILKLNDNNRFGFLGKFTYIDKYVTNNNDNENIEEIIILPVFV